MNAAVRRGDLAAVEALIAAGANINDADEDGFTPLLRAVFDGQVEATRYLIAGGADVNVRQMINLHALRIQGIEIDHERPQVSVTALVAAAFMGHQSIVELLVENGADVNAATADKQTPLKAALEGGHHKIARYLLAHAADLEKVRLDDRESSKELAGMLFADLPYLKECDWTATSRPTTTPEPESLFPASGQTTAYRAGTRASRGRPVAVPDDGTLRAGAALRFVDNGDGTISDGNTGLMWEKKCGGGGGLHDYRRVYRWADRSADETIWGWIAAINAERTTGFAGYDDWRIPNVKELQSIIDYERFGPAVTPTFHDEQCRGCMNLGAPECSCAAPSFHWTATTFADFVAHAYSVGFGSGLIDDAVKSRRLFIRAVRGGR